MARSTRLTGWFPQVVFNGDNYDEANQEMLTKRGVWRIDSGVDAICRYSDPKNTALFEAMGVLKPNECAARQACFLRPVGFCDFRGDGVLLG